MHRYSLALCLAIFIAATAVSPASGEGTVGLAVAGSAFLVNFYLGSMEVLLREGIVTPETPMGGLSGGAFTTMLTCAGATPQELHQFFKSIMTSCSQNWNKTDMMLPCQGQVWEKSVANLAEFFPDDPQAENGDIYKRCNHVGIAYSKINETRNTYDSAYPIVVNDYQSNADVRAILGATSYLSCFSACDPYILYRDHAAMDGGYSATLDDLCPKNVDRCIKLEVYYPNTTDKGVACDVQGADNSKSGLIQQCVTQNGGQVMECDEPLPKDFPFAPKGNLPTTCAAAPSVYAFPGKADIYPGRFTYLNMTCFEWQCLSYFVQPDMIDKLYEIGKAEAEAWVKYDREQNGGGSALSAAPAPAPASSEACKVAVKMAVMAIMAVIYAIVV